MPAIRTYPRLSRVPVLLSMVLITGCGLMRGTEGSGTPSRPATGSPENRLIDSEASDFRPEAAASSSSHEPAQGQTRNTTVEDLNDGLTGLPPQPSPANVVNPWVWGIVELRGYPMADQIAPNGVEYKPIFSSDLHFNLWLWRQQRLYGYSDLTFWAQKAAPGITNPSQGPFDFSKREFDLIGGLAWNYSGRWEARAFAYSSNNLNRGDSATAPAGFNDGVGIENRYYLGKTYDALGTADFDLARATFISAGYYPSKDMVDCQGNTFKPGLFARAYLTLDLVGDQCYLFADTTVIARNTVLPKLLDLDVGIALRPFIEAKRVEFRIGSKDIFDLQFRDTETSIYGAVRFIY